MKQFVFIGLIVFLAIPAMATEASGVKFRDIPWGTHIDSTYKNGERLSFVEVEEARASNAYRLENEDLSIGTVNLEKIHYIFNDDNRLTRIYMEGNEEDRADMNFIIRHRFGQPDDIKELVRTNIREWDLGDLKITLTEYPERDMFVLTFASRWDQTEAYRINTNIDDF